MDKTFSSGEVVKIVGVSYRTLLRWEEEGIIRPPARDWKGERRYTKENIEEIKKVKQLQGRQGWKNVLKNLEKGRKLLHQKQKKKEDK